MKIAIAGAGAIGCRFGYMLYESGADVVLIDRWKEHVEKIKSDGLDVEIDGMNKNVKIPIYYPEERTDKFDVIVVFTKSMMLEEMLKDISNLITDKTRVISLLNGIGHENVLKKYVKLENIIIGVTIFTAGLAGPGKSILNGTGTTEMQNFLPNADSEHITKEIVNIFNKAGLNTTYSTNVKFSIWRKACVNSAMNALCAILDSNLEQFIETKQSENIIRQLVNEFVDIANKNDVRLSKDEMFNYIVESSRKVGKHYPSMHQDLVQNNRYTEVDFLNGAISEFGKQFNIETPYNDFLTELIHAKEQILNVK